MPRKRKNAFKLPYIAIDRFKGNPIIYNENGDFGMVLRITNPVLQYSANPESYDSFHRLYVDVHKTLGEGYLIQKQDVISKKKFNSQPSHEYLQKKFDGHFKGRDYTSYQTFITNSKRSKQGLKMNHLYDFIRAVEKTTDLLIRNGVSVAPLTEKEVHNHIMRMLSMNFQEKHQFLNNILSGEQQIEMGDTAVRSISLINTDTIDLPQEVSTHRERMDKDTLKGFPMDNMGFLFNAPNFKTIVYNQIIDIVPQVVTQRKLELKRKRHSGIPDPANNMCVEDIDQLLEDIVRNNQLLVNSHFNIAVACEKESIEGTANFIESSLFQQGIVPSKNAYNQLELFRSLLPCNGVELKPYDFFLTTSDAALCFFFKESTPRDEESNFQIRLTDRQGIPVKID